MVKYNRVTIIFYAVVDNYSSDICWPNDQAVKLFKQYDLDMVAMESSGIYSTFNDLCDGLYQTFRDIAKSKIIEEEEGSVLYLIKRDKEGPEKDKVLSLCKLKTLEYRLFRKMREKLRNYFRGKSTNKSVDSIINAFAKEALVLSENLSMPKPL
jgi:hypothetical protein